MTSAQQQGQRIGVFVDVQNLYYSARFIHNAKVNFKAVLEEAVAKRVLIRAIAYVIATEDLKNEVFFDALKNIGFEVKSKDLQIFYGGAKKGDWDVGVAVDAIELAPKLDTLILVSGDGDYVPLVEHLKRAMGCRVEVCAFGKSTSSKLRESADLFTDLDDNRKFLLKQHPSRDRKESTHSSPRTNNSRNNHTARQPTEPRTRNTRRPSTPQSTAHVPNTNSMEDHHDNKRT